MLATGIDKHRAILNREVALDAASHGILGVDAKVTHEELEVADSGGHDDNLLSLREQDVFGEQSSGQRLDDEATGSLATLGLVGVGNPVSDVLVHRVREHIQFANEPLETVHLFAKLCGTRRVAVFLEVLEFRFPLHDESVRGRAEHIDNPLQTLDGLSGLHDWHGQKVDTNFLATPAVHNDVSQRENLVLSVVTFVKDERVAGQKLTGVVGFVQVVSEIGDAEGCRAENLLGFLVGAEGAASLAVFVVFGLLGAAEHPADFAINRLAVFVNDDSVQV